MPVRNESERQMSGEFNVYGKKSYEFAVGRIKATKHPVLNREQWSRLREADIQGAAKLLEDYGYPHVAEGGSVRDAIDAEMERAVSFILELAPDEELTNYLFFEEDALNLKLYLKAKLIGKDGEKLPTVRGSFSTELLRICAYTEDFTMLGDDLNKALDGVSELTDPAKISSCVDNAMFSHALKGAEKKRCRPVAELLTVYGVGRNRLTAMRMGRMGREIDPKDDVFLPVSFSGYLKKDSGLTEDEIFADVNRRLDGALSQLGYDSGMGVLAQYYFQKKNEAAALRLLFAQKSLDALGGNDE